MKKPCTSNEGQVFVLVAIMLVVLLAFAGLALDVGMMYGVKAKLDAAVDGAALAAGKVASRGGEVVQTRAREYFAANFPRGLLGATVTDPQTTTLRNPNRSYTVTVSATATVPTYFAKVVGVRSFTFDATSTSISRTVDLMLVMDTSLSLDTPPETLDLLKEAALGFVAKFDPSTNRVGLVHFASGAVLDADLNGAAKYDKRKVQNEINSLGINGATTAEEALRVAKEQLDKIDDKDQSPLRVIVFFSDGAPNGVAADFVNAGATVRGALYSENDGSIDWAKRKNLKPFRLFDIKKQYNPLDDAKLITVLPATDYIAGDKGVKLQSYNNIRALSMVGEQIDNTWCNVNKAARNMTENVANSARSESPNPIYIFTIGLGNGVKVQEVTFCDYGSNESGENILKRIANETGVDTYNPSQPSGMYVWAADPTQLRDAFDRIANMILRIAK